MSLFISDALAAIPATTAQPVNSPFSSIIMLVGFVLIFYFLLWRPQSKRAKEHRDLMSSLAQGDEVVTNGGILGKIVKVCDSFLILNISDSLDVKCQKGAIASTVPKGTIESI